MTTFYRNCTMPSHMSRTGWYEAYVRLSYSDGRFVRADTIGGLREIITETLASRGLSRACD